MEYKIKFGLLLSLLIIQLFSVSFADQQFCDNGRNKCEERCNHYLSGCTHYCPISSLVTNDVQLNECYTQCNQNSIDCKNECTNIYNHCKHN